MHHVAVIVAGESELAGQMPVCILIDDITDIAGIITGEGAIEHDLRHRHLTALDFAACFEIDRVGETFFVLHTRGTGQIKPLGRRARTMSIAGDLAFRRHGFTRRLRIDRGIG